MKTIEVVAGVIRDGEKFFATQRGYGEFKDGWEFPGGKLEPGETPEEALVRELKEELAIDILVKDFICTVEYDYPKFHLTMHCFYCEIQRGTPQLLEHENAKWLSLAELNSVNFLPADVEVVKKIKREF
ncbi:MAG: 8-oxo-dGTP diphosphatase MutT [Hallerella porci]|uniref:8-oxo-dGTP diphosphatase n=1 Tax=Hallerella porci TaxID=1945871 RepID=A0ABX5LN46_9BACT|nr:MULTISPECIES: 8-oxo-dGTP diphosphatase MutT [Hallerella]MCI5599723.1 8-oxo-dGTP diphosphatase MutT [Hallerella sp.]MDY3922423.1 8-oxo-dGTP diphosphatase MutT [Hallerella porci]PWK94475.1 8-oxo-dGTP diphosphatase [Hallerella porci]